MTADVRHPKSGLYVISGPGGVGKSTIVARLRGLPGVFYSVSATTRAPRPGEVDGRDYRFLSRDEFEKMISASAFLEYAEVAGNLYGTPGAPVTEALSAGRKVLVDVDVQGADQIRRQFPAAVLVFVEPPGVEALEERMRRRGAQSPDAIRRRIALAAIEMSRASEYDYSVVNDDLDQAVARVRSIMEV
jgi:guanylate kinase